MIDELRIEEMKIAFEDGPPEALPSNMWDALNSHNVAQLRTDGYGHFRQTLALNYFTWIVSPLRDSQIGFLLRSVPLPETVGAFVRAAVGPKHRLLSRKQSFEYDLLTRLLWSYVEQEASSLAARVSETFEGDPPRVYHHSRLISQDLANAILEYKAIDDALPSEARRGTILEVGAGYGRTASVFLQVMKDVRYIVVDMPPALWVAERYLTSRFPELPAFRFRSFDDYAEIEEQMATSKLIFLLPGQLALLPPDSIDLTLNISSLHEMRPEQIQWFIEQFDRLTRGHIYLKQWRRFVNVLDEVAVSEHDYPLPPHWRNVFWRPCAVQTRFFEALLATRVTTESAGTNAQLGEAPGSER